MRTIPQGLMTTLACATLFLVSMSASAQVTNLSLTLNPSKFTAADCDAGTKLLFSVGYNSAGTTSSKLQIYSAPGTTCPTSISPLPDGVTKVGNDLVVSDAGTFTKNASDFGNPTVFSLGFCGTVTTGTRILCVFSVGTTIDQTASQLYTFDTTSSSGTATVPTVTLAAGDERINVSLSSSSNNNFDICHATSDKLAVLTATQDCSEAGLNFVTDVGSDYTILNLSNGVAYAVSARSRNTSGTTTTLSAWSTPKQATPFPAFSSLEAYEGVSGDYSWQCAQSSGNATPRALLVPSLFALALFLLSPRRRKSLGMLLGLAILVTPIVASADGGSWNLGLIGTAYQPNLDARSVAAGQFPFFRCMYGSNDDNRTAPWLPLLGLEADVHAWDPWGSFQIGLATAFSWANGSALEESPAGKTDCTGTVQSSIPVDLYMLQVRPRITYVFDRYVDSFALVPYFRGGIVMQGYYFTYQGDADTGGQSRNANPLGIRFGYEATAGLMFALDVLEPSVSTRARATGVYNHSYLKAEISYMPIDGFGSEGFDFSPVGPFHWNQPIIFNFGLNVEFQ